MSIALRTLHLAGVVLAAVAILGHAGPALPGVVVMLVSGLALHGIDLWQRPGLWREVAGVFVLAKLALLVLMVHLPDRAAPLFWLLLLSSSVVSHAPHGFRHRRIVGSRTDVDGRA